MKSAAPVRKRNVRPGRNDPCDCGSGRKYKKCCGQSLPKPPVAQPPVAQPPFAQPPLRSASPERAPTVSGEELHRLEALATAGRYADLEQRVRELLIVSPELGLLWKLLALALWRQGKEALQELRTAAALLPEDAEAHSNLGNALRGCGQLEDAIRCHEQAIAIDPRYPEAHNDLGCALQGLGRLEEAAASFRRAINLKSDFATVHANLGAVLAAHGEQTEAVESFRRALRLRPDDLEVQGRLGSALVDLGRLDEAVASYRSALEVNPDAAALHSDLGWVLSLLGQTVEATRSCRKALAIDPERVAAIVLLADLEATRGEFAEAQALLRRAIALDPDSPEAWAGLMHWRTVRGADESWLAQAQRVAALPLPPRREARLRFAVGKYFDEVQDFARAFANYRRANQLMRQQARPYARKDTALYVDLATQLYDPEWLAAARSNVPGSERAVFIVGMWRSGTTLAEQILASHRDVFGAGELPYWKDAAVRYETSAAEVEVSDAERLAVLGAEYLTRVAELSPGAQRVIDKMSANFLHLGLIHAALPDARIIHMRRDPLDTCLSIYFQSFLQSQGYATDLEDIAHYYTQYHRLMEHWRRSLPGQVLLEVPYEGLIDDPELWSRRMVEFLGLPWDPACLDFHRTDRTVTTLSKWQVRQPIDRSRVARWRHYEKFIAPLLELRQLQASGN
ncbi:MAG: tetratricopeptide repeat protein [Gammaproteobacteria bacterium]|nr:tetratricopeptide repeat protein [Gammaproteobacteria bacterium]